jgi:lysophospholipase L1-like esterase
MARTRRKLGLGKRIVYSLIPVCMLLLIGEVGVRALGLVQPRVRSMPLPEELFGVVRNDGELMWSLAPNQDARVRTPYQRERIRIRTNQLGLRDRPIADKAPGEYRILSLGESSTFGAYVSDGEMYSAKLEQQLNHIDDAHRYRVINAGVSAYSSFQSLLYLRLRGYKLEPDMVLFYHEYNDYLPSSLRSSSNSAFGLAHTDMQLHASARGRWFHQIMTQSALLQWLGGRWNRYRLAQYTQSVDGQAADAIGLPSIMALPGVVELAGDNPRPYAVEHDALPRRVSDTERRAILDQLRRFCERRGIRLVIIHPSYRLTRKHTCVLTEFCRTVNVSMFEAYDVLHAPGTSPHDLFLDEMHPTPHGHTLLADALAAFIRDMLAAPGRPSRAE